MKNIASFLRSNRRRQSSRANSANAVTRRRRPDLEGHDAVLLYGPTRRRAALHIVLKCGAACSAFLGRNSDGKALIIIDEKRFTHRRGRRAPPPARRRQAPCPASVPRRCGAAKPNRLRAIISHNIVSTAAATRSHRQRQTCPVKYYSPTIEAGIMSPSGIPRHADQRR